MRWLFLVHRILGIGVGILMVMWCLSGIVMMYVSYPALSPHDRIAALAPIDWRGCCRINEALVAGAGISGFQVEMVGARPVMSLAGAPPGRDIVDLLTGEPISVVDAVGAVRTAQALTRAHVAADTTIALIANDQWTISGAFNRDQPLYRIAMDDPSGSVVYVSSRSGRAIQRTTQSERFWNWLGAIPHWLYFAALRSHPRLWTQVVVYTSLVGSFLAGTGLYLGIQHLRAARARNAWLTFHGVRLWHHLPGLVFGLFLLAWIFSGFVSMNPWGFLESQDASMRSDEAVTAAEIETSLSRLAADDAHVVSVVGKMSGGRLWLVRTDAAGNRERRDSAGRPAPLAVADIATQLDPRAKFDAPHLLPHGDAYYFSHHSEPASLPVYRLIAQDGTRVWYYVDPISGDLLARFDPNQRRYRWLFAGLHRLDFAAPLRARPLWDVVTLILLGGVTVICVTGVYLAVAYLRRSLGGVRNSRR